MSLMPQPLAAIPEETVRVAQAAFPKPTRFMRMRDQLGSIYEDAVFAELYPRRGQPAEAPWRLALVTLMQFADNLSDRQAADAVRGRIDWKYALALNLDDPGFHYSVLSKFRTRLTEAEVESLLLDTLLERLQTEGWLKSGGRARTDSTHVLAAIRTLNRLENVGETLRAALNDLAVVAPAIGYARSLVQSGSNATVSELNNLVCLITIKSATPMLNKSEPMVYRYCTLSIMIRDMSG
jgi:transposase